MTHTLTHCCIVPVSWSPELELIGSQDHHNEIFLLSTLILIGHNKVQSPEWKKPDRVHVLSKSMTETAWICLPDSLWRFFWILRCTWIAYHSHSHVYRDHVWSTKFVLWFLDLWWTSIQCHRNCRTNLNHSAASVSFWGEQRMASSDLADLVRFTRIK